MKTTINDREVLAALRPVDLLAYLRSAGWNRQAEIGERASLWIKNAGNGEGEDVSVPLRRDAADFVLRAAEVLSTLERLEGRAQEDILRDITSTSSDLVRIRALTPESGDGTIPLSVGVDMVEHARELLEAAACATVGPRQFWARRRPPQATDFMSQVRMGQTERGSYVLTILSPVAPALKDDSDAESPFERRVTETLTRALRAVLHAAHATCHPSRRGVYQADLELHLELVERDSASFMPTVLGETTC